MHYPAAVKSISLGSKAVGAKERKRQGAFFCTLHLVQTADTAEKSQLWPGAAQCCVAGPWRDDDWRNTEGVKRTLSPGPMMETTLRHAGLHTALPHVEAHSHRRLRPVRPHSTLCVSLFLFYLGDPSHPVLSSQFLRLPYIHVCTDTHTHTHPLHKDTDLLLDPVITSIF